MSLSFCTSATSVVSRNPKAIALETTIQQCIYNFKELILEFDQLQIESENTKTQYLSLKEKCESKKCTSAEELRKIIIKKDEIINSVASILTKLNETRNYNIISEAFKILCQDLPLTPPEEKDSPKEKKALKTKLNQKHNNISPEINNIKIKEEKDGPKDDIKCPTKIYGLKDDIKCPTEMGLKEVKKCPTASKNSIKDEKVSPNKSILDDVSFNDESVSEIEGTPTGRTSPIIQSKKARTILGASDFRDKKKAAEEWPTSNSKVFKLVYTTPSRNKTGKWRQSRINLVSLKNKEVVDLTCSPEVKEVKSEPVQALVKKESIENDDTILPSPTSGPTNFNILKTTIKESPQKFKKPNLSLVKKEKVQQDENKDLMDMEDSINILKRIPDRLRHNNNNIQNESPTFTEAMDEDATHCDTEFSVSLLNHIQKLETAHGNKQNSATKRPLAENINIMNTPPKNDAEPSISLLKQHNPAVDNVKRKLPELAEPICKEPTVRKKQEKRNLQGWSCEQCKNFYGVLYKDDPVMLARKINDCSKHRGKHNPARPKTPEGYWNPRWEVPDDTEELNRMNDAV